MSDPLDDFHIDDPHLPKAIKKAALASGGYPYEEKLDWDKYLDTVGDLQRFDSALLRGRLLPPRLLRQMLTPVPGSDVFPGHGSYRYGLGLIIATLPCGVTVYGHGGTIDGSLSWVAGTRDGRHTMSFDVNGDWVDQPALTGAADRAEFCSTAGRGTPPSPEHRDPVPPAAWLRAARRP